jgi:hypothetical protein
MRRQVRCCTWKRVVYRVSDVLVTALSPAPRKGTSHTTVSKSSPRAAMCHTDQHGQDFTYSTRISHLETTHPFVLSTHRPFRPPSQHPQECAPTPTSDTAAAAITTCYGTASSSATVGFSRATRPTVGRTTCARRKTSPSMVLAVVGTAKNAARTTRWSSSWMNDRREPRWGRGTSGFR